MKWRIYYGDGSTYDSRNGSPYDAPAHNVQIIASYDAPDIKVRRGKDFYVWFEDTGWLGMDWTGVVTSYLNRPGPQKVICGATMPDADDYWNICKRALSEGWDGDS